METKVVRENTVKLKFGVQNRVPTNAEMFAFFRKQNWNEDMLSAMYKEDYSLLVKFRSKQLMLDVLARFGDHVEFEYEDGSKVMLVVSAACGVFKYVRVFGLPPEVEDKPIAEVLGKFGNIHQMVRERFPAETGFPIWNGVRGIHMEVTAELPAQVYVHHIRARVYYDGFQNKCFSCGSTEHLKVDCPKKLSVQNRLESYAHPPLNRGGAGKAIEKGSKNGTGLGNAGKGAGQGKAPAGSNSMSWNEMLKSFPILPPTVQPCLESEKDQQKKPEPQPRAEGEQENGWVTIPVKERLRGRGLRPKKATDEESDTEDLFKVPIAPNLAKLQSTRSRSLNSRKKKDLTDKELADLIDKSPSSKQTPPNESNEEMASEEDAHGD